MAEQESRETGRLSPDFQRKLPIASAEDVEYSEELAGPDDKEAQERAREADRRARSYEGE
jgi:hypothetical protein